MCTFTTLFLLLNAIECSDPGGVDNSVRSAANWPYTVNTQFTYTCNKCYTGSGTITCQSDGTWSQKPQCKGLLLLIVQDSAHLHIVGSVL